MDEQMKARNNGIDVRKAPDVKRLYFPFDTELFYGPLYFKAGDYMISGKFVEQYCPLCDSSNTRLLVKEYRPTMEIDRVYHEERMILVLPVGHLSPYGRFYSRLAEDVENSTIIKSTHWYRKERSLAFVWIEGKFYIYNTRRYYDPGLWPQWTKGAKSGWIWHQEMDSAKFIWLEGEILPLPHAEIEERPHRRCQFREYWKEERVKVVLEDKYSCTDFIVIDLNDIFYNRFDEKIIERVIDKKRKIIIVGKIYDYSISIEGLDYYTRKLLQEGYEFIPLETLKNEVTRWYITKKDNCE